MVNFLSFTELSTSKVLVIIDRFDALYSSQKLLVNVLSFLIEFFFRLVLEALDGCFAVCDLKVPWDISKGQGLHVSA